MCQSHDKVQIKIAVIEQPRNGDQGQLRKNNLVSASPVHQIKKKISAIV
jgi:hypothetical protein